MVRLLSVFLLLVPAMLFAAGPNLSFVPNDTVSFGLISGKEVESRTIKAVNTGDEPLAITFAHTDCSCTVADYSKEPVQPGDTTEITVRFDPRGRRHGRFSKVIRLRTNADPPVSVLFLKGSIQRPVVRE